ncbi:MAG: pyruvate dehydrogenase [Anaerolineales bacterium]|nr:pyruvate dehydrogenase [Anaerolineales bacterium]
MRRLHFADAIDEAIGQAMDVDPRILIFGEDVHLIRRNLLVRFGHDRVRNTPVSEGAFVGAAVAAAMAGLQPIVDLYRVDFITVAMDALVNHAAKVETFSGGRWNSPIVLRATAGGGYGDGGQHEQSLWGWLAHIPGLNVVVPSTPADAGGLMLRALHETGPVVFLEHILLSHVLLDFLGSGGRKTVEYDVPVAGARGYCPKIWEPIPFGSASLKREGDDLTMVSVGVGVHRCLEAADRLMGSGISASVLDLRTVSPLDTETVCAQVAKTARMLVVDEDYEGFGLSGELAAVILEAGIPVRFARVCTQETIPYAQRLEGQVIPNVERIVNAALTLLDS